jgi:hypothetical protein
MNGPSLRYPFTNMLSLSSLFLLFVVAPRHGAQWAMLGVVHSFWSFGQIVKPRYRCYHHFEELFFDRSVASRVRICTTSWLLTSLSI